MKLSARNVIPGRIVKIRKGVTTATVKIEVGKGAIMTSTITREAVEELKLKVGDKVSAIVKSSDVIVGK